MSYLAYALLGFAVGQGQLGVSVRRAGQASWPSILLGVLGIAAIFVPFGVFLGQGTGLAVTFLASAIASWLVKISYVDRVAERTERQAQSEASPT